MTEINSKTTQTYTKADCLHAVVRLRGKEYVLRYKDDPHSLCAGSLPRLTITTKNGKTDTLYYQAALDAWCELADKPGMSRKMQEFIWRHCGAAEAGERRCKRKWKKK